MFGLHLARSGFELSKPEQRFLKMQFRIPGVIDLALVGYLNHANFYTHFAVYYY